MNKISYSHLFLKQSQKWLWPENWKSCKHPSEENVRGSVLKRWYTFNYPNFFEENTINIHISIVPLVPPAAPP